MNVHSFTSPAIPVSRKIPFKRSVGKIIEIGIGIKIEATRCMDKKDYRFIVSLQTTFG
jgi:hypothetical protein